MLAKSWLVSCQNVDWQAGTTFLVDVGLNILTFCQNDGMCWDDISFGGSWQRNMMSTFPTKEFALSHTNHVYSSLYHPYVA